jgi:hypothetical protein
MHRACLSLILFAWAAVAQAPRTIPFELYANAIWFEGSVNGSRPLHFLALSRNLIGSPFHAAFCRTRNSVLVATMR